ncbi:hypothetical protein [Candidatus Coxiella mudrowiae]|uniref:hypothetical protein n=1 Tax=Candidatus Coxiella mudrowiae TaxID=2054173 RepID=UPI0006629CF9|nr:hypothetical protein [Candidatus Coxiella mudrowiae]
MAIKELGENSKDQKFQERCERLLGDEKLLCVGISLFPPIRQKELPPTPVLVAVVLVAVVLRLYRRSMFGVHMA